MANKQDQENTEFRSGVHPQKFLLWVGMASMTMLFAALTSAMIVKKADYVHWQEFNFPKVFGLSTLFIVGTSIFLHRALNAYRASNWSGYRSGLIIGMIMAVLFIASQAAGWLTLQSYGIYISGNPSGSFIYVISGLHGIHLLGGMVFLIMALVQAIRSKKDPIYELKNIINPKRQLHLEILVGYWHYVDLLWVYLFFFFYFMYQ